MGDKQPKKSVELVTMGDVIKKGITSIYETNDVLCKLWRILLWESKISGPQWHTKLKRWNTRNQKIMTKKKATNLSSNVTRTLAKDVISWKSILRGFSILEYDRMDVQITLWKRDVPTTLKLNVEDLTDACRGAMEGKEDDSL